MPPNDFQKYVENSIRVNLTNFLTLQRENWMEGSLLKNLEY